MDEVYYSWQEGETQDRRSRRGGREGEEGKRRGPSRNAEAAASGTKSEAAQGETKRTTK